MPDKNEGLKNTVSSCCRHYSFIIIAITLYLINMYL